MKKILLFVCSALLIGFSSCSSDDDTTSPDDENITLDEAYRRKMVKEYGISETGGLSIVSVGENKDVALFEGRMNNHLWIRCYNTKNKEIILQWQDAEELKKDIEVDLGYGDKEIISIDRYESYRWLYTDESLIFQLIGEHDNTHYFSSASHDVYFISQNRLVKKIHTNIYPSVYYGELVPWYKGVAYAIDGKSNYYDAYGNPLQIVELLVSAIDGDFINYYEAIYIDEEQVRRLSYENGTVIWEVKSPLADIPKTARRESSEIQKNKNIWTCTFNYTRYEGTKINLIFEVNIDTGEIKILKQS